MSHGSETSSILPATEQVFTFVRSLCKRKSHEEGFCPLTGLVAEADVKPSSPGRCRRQCHEGCVATQITLQQSKRKLAS